MVSASSAQQETHYCRHLYPEARLSEEEPRSIVIMFLNMVII